MPYTTPKYQITVPSPTTRLDKLGPELQQLGTSLEAALSKFDYGGKDPNLVLARVAALEVQASKHQAGKAGHAGGNGGGSGGIIWTAPKVLNFPKAFPAGSVPTVSAWNVSGDHITFVAISEVTNTNFTYRICRAGNVAPTGGTIHWTADLP